MKTYIQERISQALSSKRQSAHIVWEQAPRINMILLDVQAVMDRAELQKEYPLEVDILIWSVKLAQDVLGRGRSLVGNVIHVMAVE